MKKQSAVRSERVKKEVGVWAPKEAQDFQIVPQGLCKGYLNCEVLSSMSRNEISVGTETYSARVQTVIKGLEHVMGATGSGKTTFINSASGSNLRVGRGLQSCTSDIQAAEPFQLDSRSVILIDTPGFDDTSKSDTDILRLIAAFLSTAYENGHKLSGIIYIHRISDFRMGGISTRNFKMFRQLCGENSLKNVVILTNMWGEVGREVGEAREHELATEDIFFKPVLDKGAQMLRHDNTQEMSHNELVEEKKDISETAAGEELNRELIAQYRKHKEEMKQLQEEMQGIEGQLNFITEYNYLIIQIAETIRTKDEETKLELELEKLATKYNEEKRQMEQRMQKMASSARKDFDKAAADYNRQMGELRVQLQQTFCFRRGKEETSSPDRGVAKQPTRRLHHTVN
ncbi:P-loop containing nucleoside triphosphate hydrolase protein [Gymnopilus junonius]|uniref:P-loop containing nucleoside triphosphate hydrolase protein n=1 Tax=Gymnopilus junonius TaxID=109634 RepID=A0A9P5P022_GYMJU|nr:P-loop containing nucleoside triphosphate hydrolase protein [Gymnopilus junonius]